MNFNLKQQRTKFGLGPPIMRHFSNIGLCAAKPPAHEQTLKPDFLFHGVHSQILDSVSGGGGLSVLSTKSFSNPNFVNKNNPNILTPSMAGALNFPVALKQPAATCEAAAPIPSSQSVETQKTAREASPKPNHKSQRSRHNKKPRRNAKQHKKELSPGKRTCSSPKRMRRDPALRNKNKPWHKINFNMEIMECDELSSSIEMESPQCADVAADSAPTFCLQLQSSPVEILPLRVSSSSCSDGSSLSPSSPALRRLRVPSECDSEDSFIIFCDDSNSCQDLSSDDDDVSDASDESDEQPNSLYSSDDDDDVVDLIARTNLNRKKKVTFKSDGELCEVHPMVKWGFAYHTARVGPWEQMARDRSRFEARIRSLEPLLAPILADAHRRAVFQQRFQDVATTSD